MVDRIERLLGRIPGYDAYNRKESMRDDDRRLRMQIADRLAQAVSDLTGVSSGLASRRQLGSISVVEDLIRDTRLLSDRVRSASYGYSGVFSDQAVDEFALAQLKAFDVAFDARVEAFTAGIADIDLAGDMTEARIRDVSTQLDDLDRLFSARDDVISTASPTDDPKVLSLLERPDAPSGQEQRLLRLRNGGTIAILGDNFQVTGHIVMKNRDDAVVLSLLLLDDGPNWLAVMRRKGVQCWNVTEDAAAAPPMSQPSDASADVSGPQGTQADVPAKYDVEETDAGGAATVSIRLAIRTETRAFSGTSVPTIDIDVFTEG